MGCVDVYVHTEQGPTRERHIEFEGAAFFFCVFGVLVCSLWALLWLPINGFGWSSEALPSLLFYLAQCRHLFSRFGCSLHSPPSFIFPSWVPGFLDLSTIFSSGDSRNEPVFAFGRLCWPTMGFHVLLSFLCLLFGGGWVENGSFNW